MLNCAAELYNDLDTSSKNVISIESLLLICKTFQIPMNDLLSSKINKVSWPNIYETKEKIEFVKRRKIDWENVENRLRFIMNAEIHPVPSLKKISKDIRIDKKQLRERYPDLTKHITEKYLKYKRNKAIEHKNHLKKSLQDAVIKFHSLGIYPSANRVAQAIGRPAIMLQKELHDYWRQLLFELGY